MLFPKTEISDAFSHFSVNLHARTALVLIGQFNLQVHLAHAGRETPVGDKSVILILK